MTRTVETVIAVLVAVTWHCADTVSARSCRPPLPVEREFEMSEAVFIGTITKIDVQDRGGAIGTRTVATFSVERAWKGAEEPTIRVGTCGGGNVICTVGLTFNLGERYVVFAMGPDLGASKCGRTGTESHYLWNDTIDWLLRQPKQPAG